MSSASDADRHAMIAGLAMTNKQYEESTGNAAFRVLGHAGDTAIEALSVTGTTWHGSAVLRVTVTHDAQLPQPDRTVRCFRYLFDRSSSDDARPKRLSRCPDSEPLALTSPAPGLDLSANAAKALASTLTALPAERRTAQAVSMLLAQRYSAPATFAVEQSGPTTVTIRVSDQDACLLGELSIRGTARVTAAVGSDCRGG